MFTGEPSSQGRTLVTAFADTVPQETVKEAKIRARNTQWNDRREETQRSASSRIH
jgi:hypothetical protein